MCSYQPEPQSGSNLLQYTTAVCIATKSSTSANLPTELISAAMLALLNWSAAAPVSQTRYNHKRTQLQHSRRRGSGTLRLPSCTLPPNLASTRRDEPPMPVSNKTLQRIIAGYGGFELSEAECNGRR